MEYYIRGKELEGLSDEEFNRHPEVRAYKINRHLDKSK